MAVTTENSTQMANVEAKPRAFNVPTDWESPIRFMRFNFVQGAAAGDAGSFARLFKLPAGKARVINSLSRVAFSAMGAARTLDLGWEAYTDDQNNAVAADPNGLDDGVDVSSAGSVTPGGTIGGDETKLFESHSGVVVTAQINDGTIPAGATLDGHVAYVIA